MMSQLYKVIQLILRGRAKIWALGFQSHDVKHDIDFLLYLSFQKHKHRRNFYHLLPIRKSFFLFYFILFNLKFALEKKTIKLCIHLVGAKENYCMDLLLLQDHHLIMTQMTSEEQKEGCLRFKEEVRELSQRGLSLHIHLLNFLN